MTAALFDLAIQGSKDGGGQDGENSRDQRNPGLAETDRNPDAAVVKILSETVRPWIRCSWWCPVARIEGGGSMQTDNRPTPCDTGK